MNKITKHIPNFVDSRDPPPSGQFETQADLETIPFVKQWKDDKGFVRFSLSDNRLMAEMVGEFWVVGYLQNPSTVDLPQWQHP